MSRHRADGYFERVYEIVARIARGKVMTYGQIAAFLGHPRGARTVGWAMRDAPRDRKLPCHRVVNAAGTMAPGDIFGGAEVQRKRLEAEGVTFTKSGRIALEKHRWQIRGSEIGSRESATARATATPWRGRRGQRSRPGRTAGRG